MRVYGAALRPNTDRAVVVAPHDGADTIQIACRPKEVPPKRTL